MARATPTIREGILIAHEAGQTTSIGVGSEQWFAWLHKETSTSFSFHIREGSYTARKERVGNRRGGWYWKAYRKRQGTLYRAYLGKPEDLTLARLSEIALALSQRTQGKVREDQDISAMEQRNHRQMQHEASVMPLLETRLHPPQLPVVLVERSGLLTRLDASLAHKLTLLLAPAGFGKTTLVNQWLAARSTSSTFPALAWVSLDASDNDPLRFWRAVITACQRLPGPEQQAAGQAALALLTTPIHPPFEQAPIEIALTRLLNALAETSSGGLLVLDDYHVISEQRLHETLAFFIEHLPATVHIVLLSRAEPALPLLRWRARGQLCELHTFDLRFSSQETASFLHQALPVYTLSEQVLARLHISLEGWAAGLRLLCLTLARSQSPQAVEQALLSLSERTDCSSPHRALLDYFVSEILETQPEPMQRFLLQTSMLSRLCGPLCDAVTGGERKRRIAASACVGARAAYLSG